jgi:hypothetical protein
MQAQALFATIRLALEVFQDSLIFADKAKSLPIECGQCKVLHSGRFEPYSQLWRAYEIHQAVLIFADKAMGLPIEWGKLWAYSQI